MSQNHTTLWFAIAAAVTIAGILWWKKSRRSFVRVGTISKLYFYPIKSLRGVQVEKGKCTKLGFEVDGLLDRSFMLINKEGVAITLEKAPSLTLLTLQFDGITLNVKTPSGKTLNIDIKDTASSDDKMVHCRVYNDSTKAVDCGDTAASFFQSFLNRPDARLVRHLPDSSVREYHPKGKGKSFQHQLRKENPKLGFQSLMALHVISKPSIEDLNSKLEDYKVSVINFRPNILVDGCEAFAEDSWRFIKFNSGVLLSNQTLFERCLTTTIDPDTGIMNQIEPLKTLRKYRIPTEPEILEKTGPFPCLGIGCNVWKAGNIAVGDDVFADVGPRPKMRERL